MLSGAWNCGDGIAVLSNEFSAFAAPKVSTTGRFVNSRLQSGGNCDLLHPAWEIPGNAERKQGE
jgi:hypothetical protein